MSATEDHGVPPSGVAKHDTDTDALPPLADGTVERIEKAVFSRIAADRGHVSRRRRTHRRAWVGVGSAAAVIAVAAVIAPNIGALVSPMSAGSSAADSAAAPFWGATNESGRVEQQAATGAEALDAAAEAGADSSAGALTTEGGVQDGRDIVASASANVTVDDVAVAADDVAAAAEQYGGYVESLSVGTNGGVVSPLVDDTSVMYPEQPRAGYGWVNVRVPAEQLETVIGELDSLGDVSGVSINRSDVTDQAIDLRARVAATSASVDRLTQLMAQSGSVADLIAAEVALSERQALLEGYEQQLAQLDSQVALSSLNVQLTVKDETAVADPAGFGDGLVAGWNGLVATLNGIVVALGFLLPWIIVAGVAALIIRLVVRGTRRRRASRDDVVREPVG